jgi:signal transduction histidine kinase
VADPQNATVFQNIPLDWGDFDAEQLESLRVQGDLQWSHVLGAEEEGEWIPDPDRLEILSARLPDGFSLHVGKTTEARKEILEYFQRSSALLMLAVLGIGLAGGTLLARRSLRPLRDLAETLRSVRETGRLDARVPTRRTGDELDELAGLFNSLLDTIESLVTRMRSALDNIAHELRTPMTRLRGSAEMALRSESDAQHYRQALTDCLEEAEQTLTTLNTLMDVAEAEAGAMKLELEEIDLASLIGGVVGLYEHVAEEKNISLRAVAPAGLRVRADPRRLRQVVANLLDNALKYTSAGGQVEIAAAVEQQRLRISVQDTGAGIRAEELPKVWDRLYRGEAGLSQRGLGLGLSLVRAVVLAHNGSVEARSEPGKGSLFVIQLPLSPPGLSSNLSKI